VNRYALLVLGALCAFACSRKQSERADSKDSVARTQASATAHSAAGVASAASATPAPSDEPVLIVMPTPAPPPEARPDASGPRAVRAVFDGYGFPMVAYFEPLCANRVGHGDDIVTWDAFVSELSPGELVAAFKKRLGEAGFSANGEGGNWRLPAGSPSPTRSLVVTAPTEHGPHDACANKPAKGAKSVLLLTREE